MDYAHRLRPTKGESGLAGTAWTLALLDGETPFGDTSITLEFADETFSGYSGCNWYGGDYAVTETTLSLADGGGTARACTAPAGVIQQEEAYGQALYKTATYRVSKDLLQLLDGAGTVILTFARGAGESKP